LGNRDLRGLSHYDVFPEIPERWKEVHRRGLAGEVVRHEGERFDRADGTQQWLRWEVRPWRDDAGDIGGIVVFTEDITERKRVEEALRESEARMRALFEHSMVGMLLTSPEGGVFAANQAACRMFGRTEDEICRLGRAGLVDPHDERLEGLLQRRARYGRVAGEVNFLRADGTSFPALVVSATFETKDGLRSSMVIQDISDRVLAEERIRDFSRRLLTAREEERHRISGALHHDVGSMAVSVTARLNAVEDQLRTMPEGNHAKAWREKSKEALASLQACRQLFDQSVARLKMVAAELRPPDLDLLGLRAALRQHFSRVGQESSLRIQFSDTTRKKRIPAEIQTVLFRVAQECLNNVIAHAEAHKVQVRLSATRQAIHLSVSDDGKGFDPRLATPTANKHMGLRAMQEMVSGLGGKLEIAVGGQRGAEISVTIPLRVQES
jgi:PAS domain S-box-containing protein